MTPSAGTTKPHTARPTRRRPAQRPPRRVSGPARGARAVVPGVATRGGGVAAAPPLGLRLARTATRIPDARFLDRLLRGRAWIALVAIGLMGIVFIQVSMLRLNAGISRAIASAETLNRQNSTLRAEISKLDSGQRIADAAGALGMIQPPAGGVNYLDARKANGRAAAQGIHPPKPAKDAAATTPGASTAPTTATTTSTSTSTAAAAQAPATSQAPAATTTQAQAATAPTTTTPQATVPQTQTQTQATAPQTQTQANSAQTPATTIATPTQTAPAVTPQVQPTPGTGTGGQ
jgi:hypothetical protein